MRRLALLLLTPVALLAPPAAIAQDIMSGGIANSWSSTQLLLNAEKEAWAAPECVDPARWSVDCPGPRPQPRARTEQPSATADIPAAPAIDEGTLRFRPSLEQRQRNFARFVAKSRAADKAGGDEIERILSDDIIGLVGKQVAPLGLRTDDVADAVALYVMEAWEVANQQVLQPDRARAQAVRRQMVRAIAATPQFAASGDAAKQELAESLIVHAALLSSGYAQAKNDGNQPIMDAVSNAARKGAQDSLGMDLRTVTMTPAGLRPKGAGGKGGR